MDIDVTYLIQFGLFLFTLVTLNGLILQPFLKVLQERDARTEGAQAEVSVLLEAGDRDMAAYQKRMREARGTAQKEREALRDEGRAQERSYLADIRAEIADTLNSARDQVKDEEARARAELARESDAMARELVERILGREVAG
jgi:F-type H+-transporting ATPase subunit b